MDWEPGPLGAGLDSRSTGIGLVLDRLGVWATGFSPVLVQARVLGSQGPAWPWAQRKPLSAVTGLELGLAQVQICKLPPFLPPFEASFLISVLHSGAVVTHLETFNWVFLEGNPSVLPSC